MAKLTREGAWKQHTAVLTLLVSLVVFLIFLCVKADAGGPDYVYVLIPWFLALLALCYISEVTLNSYSRSNYDYVRTLTRILSLSILILVASGSVLLALKADNTLDVPWPVAFAPLWCALVLLAVVIIVLFPGLIDPTIKLHRLAFLGTVYLATAVLVSVLTALHLELDIPPNWALVFVSVWICAIMHIFSLFCLNPKSKTDDSTGPWVFELCALLMAVISAVLLNIRKDAGGVPASVVAIPLWGLLGLATCKEVTDYWFSEPYGAL